MSRACSTLIKRLEEFAAKMLSCDITEIRIENEKRNYYHSRWFYNNSFTRS